MNVERLSLRTQVITEFDIKTSLPSCFEVCICNMFYSIHKVEMCLNLHVMRHSKISNPDLILGYYKIAIQRV